MPDLTEIEAMMWYAYPAGIAPAMELLNTQTLYEVDVFRNLFLGRIWNRVEFPDENDFVLEGFALLPATAKRYYLAAYATNALHNYYYRSGFLWWLARVLPDKSATETGEFASD
jgi:hypothetical protein